VIALPLHGQNTAAVKQGHRAGGTSYVKKTRGDVFGKQARLVCLPSSFFSFLSFLKTLLCKVNDKFGVLVSLKLFTLCVWARYLSVGGLIRFILVSRRGENPLITYSSRGVSIVVWNSSVKLCGLEILSK